MRFDIYDIVFDLDDITLVLDDRAAVDPSNRPPRQLFRGAYIKRDKDEDDLDFNEFEGKKKMSIGTVSNIFY